MSDINKCWLGTSMENIYNGLGPWNFDSSPINASRYHSVLYELPATLLTPPKPHISSQVYHWDNDYVRMPFSPQNVFPIEENGTKILKERWNIIEMALLQPIKSSRQFEAAVSSYNTRLPKFLALHHFFEEILDEEEGAFFFNNLLPKIIGLALRLPEVLPGSVPLLKQAYNRSISLSQLQVSSLLANAFLCTFPWRKESAATYPGANFVRLFAAHLRPKREQAVAEKLKCIFHYFRRVTDKDPVGVITFERKSVPKSRLPDWARLERSLGKTRLHVTSEGLIEDHGLGLLQVDFANKNVGGGVIGFGCVQEEIRFIICPELIISRLFTEQLGPTEALIITGAERYSKYGGYGDSFTWEGDYTDTTPYDSWGRKRTTIVAIDALHFNKPMEQYNSSAMLRELNKAYAGFHSHLEQNLPAVATGNWGCGAFQGDPKLKALLQLMACCATHRDLVYYTFGNESLRDDLHNMHSFIVTQQIKISQLWKYLLRFSQTNVKPEHIYAYLQQAHLDSKKKPCLKNFFGGINLKNQDKNLPSTSATTASSTFTDAIQSSNISSQELVELLESSEVISDSAEYSEMVVDSSQEIIESSQEIIESSQPEDNINSIVAEQNEILNMFDLIDNDAKQEDRQKSKKRDNSSIKNIVNCTTGDIEQPKSIRISTVENNSKRKITDYFLKVDKG